MLDNVFLKADRKGDYERVPRVYMRLDRVESRRLLFEAVGADFFDELPKIEGIGGWARYSHKAPIYIIEIKRPFVPRHGWWDLYRRLATLRLPYPCSRWVEAIVDWSGGRDSIYYNLFAEAVRVRIVLAEWVPPAKAARLDSAFTLSGLPTPLKPIEDALDSVASAVEWVGVYDVGQGSANGLCDSNEAPLLYFDLGGGVTADLATFPAALSDFCYANDPFVVLSHWDWDHWSSGAKFAQASNRPWIAPVQSLGAVHATFAAGLHSAGNLLLWPPGQHSVTRHQVTIYRCTGRGLGRNHTGLAMEVVGPKGEPPILLPGDARYSAVPGALQQAYTSLVAPHHGANMRSRAVPPCAAPLPGARVAYSFGVPSSHGHPKSITFQDHQNVGWPHGLAGKAQSIKRDTGVKVKGLGHIGLGWDANPILPGHHCSQPACAVALTQT